MKASSLWWPRCARLLCWVWCRLGTDSMVTLLPSKSWDCNIMGKVFPDMPSEKSPCWQKCNTPTLWGTLPYATMAPKQSEASGILLLKKNQGSRIVGWLHLILNYSNVLPRGRSYGNIIRHLLDPSTCKLYVQTGIFWPCNCQLQLP